MGPNVPFEFCVYFQLRESPRQITSPGDARGGVAEGAWNRGLPGVARGGGLAAAAGPNDRGAALAPQAGADRRHKPQKYTDASLYSVPGLVSSGVAVLIFFVISQVALC